MNILMVIHHHRCGGAQKHMLDLSCGLKGRGYNVIYAGPMDSWVGEQVRCLKMDHMHVPLRGNKLDVYSTWKIYRRIKKAGIDIVHTHLGRGAYYGALAAKLSRVPSITTIHGFDYYKHLKKGWEARIIAVSGAVKNYLLSRGLSEEKIDIVHNGIKMISEDGSDRDKMREQLGIRNSETAICMVASFNQRKGHDVLLRAFKELQDPGLRLFLVGDKIGLYQRAVSLVSELGLENRVVFLGQRNDVREILRAMDIYVASSREEAFGISIIEAMTAGLPVIASKVDGIPEIIEDSINGLLFPVEDPEALAAKLKKLINDNTLRDQLSRNAIVSVRDRFSLNSMLDGTLDVYAKVINERKSGIHSAESPPHRDRQEPVRGGASGPLSSERARR